MNEIIANSDGIVTNVDEIIANLNEAATDTNETATDTAERIAEATLTDGRKMQYVITEDPPRGGMKHTYFTPDRSYAIQFFNRPDEDISLETKAYISALVGRYNPTLSEQNGGAMGNTERTAEYFSRKFCWPVAIVEKPEFGVVWPVYASNFFFTEKSSNILPLNGKEKRLNWFTSKNRKYLVKNELGDFRSMLHIAFSLARSIRRLHAAGLVHSDLSDNNVLIDPQTGSSLIIGIDSLVVPGRFPSEVFGTPGYIAPEVLETMGLPFDDPRRKLASVQTDLFSLAVLIYELLLLRHPLRGPKVHDPDDHQRDDFLAVGPEALFIEHPTDHSNRPKDLGVTIKDLGPELESLFIRAFVDGLHDPDRRPTAMEWENGLVKTWDLLHPCDNPNCSAKWFILHDHKKPVCPLCEKEIASDDVVTLRLLKSVRGNPNQWVDIGTVAVYHNTPLFKWHAFDYVHPNENADGEMVAYVVKHKGQWLLVNHKISGMTSPGGNIVPMGQGLLLKDGSKFRMSAEEGGLLVEVTVGK